jgi:hypothetical protein
MVLLGGREAEFPEDAAHMLLHRALGDDESCCDGGIRATLGHERQHLSLARAELLERAGTYDELTDDLGIECGAAAGDALDGVEDSRISPTRSLSR